LHKQLCAKPQLQQEQEALTLAAEMGIGTDVPVCEPTRLYIAAVTFRHGVSQFMETLEFTHYAPGSLRATEFQFWFIPFLEYYVAVCSIPLGDMEWAKEAAHKTGMKICAGTFEISGPEGAMCFSIVCEQQQQRLPFGERCLFYNHGHARRATRKVFEFHEGRETKNTGSCDT
jgi:hypothetical protein